MTPPDATADPEELFAAVVDEFTERLNRGERPTADEYATRYPHLAADLRDVLGMLSAIRPPGGPSATREPAPSRRSPHRPPEVAGFAVERELGRGGMGVVYLARQVKLNRPVALKMVLSGGHASSQERARFLAEAELIAKLQHPHVVQVHEFGADPDGRPFFALEYLPGGSLADRLRDGPLAPPVAAALVETLARAVGYAHGLGVIHRDLKPANVLFDAAGQPKVTDFGLAKQADSGSDLTATGAVLGTPSYMPPEQAAGRLAGLGPPADVYSLGAVLYECLTGRPPFRGASVFETLSQVKSRDPIGVRELQPAVPRDLETVCLKCLQKDPARRYASAAALADDLRRFLDRKPIAARPVGAVERGWRWCRRNPWVAGLGATAAGLLVALAAGSAVAAGWYRATLKDVEAAERDAQDKLWRAARDRAKAARASGLQGQRIESLKELKAAAATARRLGASAADIQTIRDEAVAALGLPDLERVKDEPVLPPPRCIFAVSPDHTYYATAIDPEPVTVCRLADDAVVAKLPLPEARDGYSQLAFSPDGRSLLITHGTAGKGDARYAARVWHWPDGPRTTCERAGAVAIYGAFRPDGKVLALVGREGKTVDLVDPATGAAAGKPVPVPVRPRWLAFRPDGRQLAAVLTDTRTDRRFDGSAMVFDLDADTRPPAFPPLRGRGPVQDAAWAPDGRIAISLVSGGWVMAFDDGGRPVDRAGKPSGGNTFLSFARSAPLFLTYSRAGTGRLWDAESLSPVMAVPSAVGPISGDGRRVVGRVGPRLQVWEYSPSPAARRVTVGGGPRVLMPGGFSPDGRVLAVGADFGKVELLDPATGGRLAVLPGTSACFLPDGSLVVGGEGGLVRWPRADIPGGARYGPPDRLATGAHDFPAADPSGRWLVTSTAARGELRDLSLPDRPVVARLPHRQPEHVAVRRDGRQAAIGSKSGHGVEVFDTDADTGRSIRTLVPEARDAAPTFSPDGRTLVVGTREAFTVFDTAEWEVVRRTEREPGCEYPGCVAYTTDGAMAAWVDERESVLLTDGRGEPLARLPVVAGGHPRHPHFSPDGRTLAVLTSSELVLWDLAAVRAGLAGVGLDWDAPPFDPRPDRPAVRVEVVGATNPGLTPEQLLAKVLGGLGKTPAIPPPPPPPAEPDPDDPTGWYQRARVRYERGDWAGAAADAERALALDPGHTRAAALLAWVLSAGPANLRDPARALALARGSLDPAGMDRHALVMGLALHRAGRPAQAVAVLRGLVGRRDGYQPAALAALALAHLGSNQKVEARAYRDAALLRAGTTPAGTVAAREAAGLIAEASGLLDPPPAKKANPPPKKGSPP